MTEHITPPAVLVAHQILLGARNTGHHTFTPLDIGTLYATLERYFDGYTVVDAQGYWKHEGVEYRECTKVITVLIDEVNNSKALRDFTGQIKQHFKQYSVVHIRLGTAAIV